MSVDKNIIKGLAEILWGSAWANHVEETRCQSVSGMEITSIMPEIPTQVYFMCERVAGHIEQANGKSLLLLVIDAAKADGLVTDADMEDVWGRIDEEYQERFGNCLMWMAMGAGVSWWDDHAKFPLKVPYGNVSEYECDLQYYAEENCEECKLSDTECEECDRLTSGKSKYCIDHSQNRS